jgi:hypothetical protein
MGSRGIEETAYLLCRQSAYSGSVVEAMAQGRRGRSPLLSSQTPREQQKFIVKRRSS